MRIKPKKTVPNPCRDCHKEIEGDYVAFTEGGNLCFECAARRYVKMQKQSDAFWSSIIAGIRQYRSEREDRDRRRKEEAEKSGWQKFLEFLIPIDGRGGTKNG